MKTKTLFLAILILNLISEIAFAQIMFQKTYGGSSLNYANSVRQTNDGGYIISGYENGELCLIKTNMNGDTLWTRSFGDAIGYSVEQTNDGGFITTGTTGATDDLYLIKTDSIGDTLWTKAIGGFSYDKGYSVKQTTDGGYIIAGSTESSGAGQENVYVIKTNNLGDTLWTRAYGGSQYDSGKSIEQTNDGGYIITGSASSFSAFSTDLYLLKIDPSGNLQWSKTFSANVNDFGSEVHQTSDGGYIIAGYSGANIIFDVYLIKTNGSGNLLWAKTYGGTNDDVGYSVQQTSDGGYIVAGYTYGFGAGQSDAYLLKIDLNGALLWSKTFGGTTGDRARSVCQTNDGGYIITGAEGGDVYLIKTDSSGNSGCNQGSPATISNSTTTQVTTPATITSSTNTIVSSPVHNISSGSTVTTLCTSVGISPIINIQFPVTISPNPFHSSTTLTINYKLFNENLSLSIFSMDGRILRRQNLTSHQTIIERNGLADGLYFYKLAENGIVKSVGKLLIE